MTKTYLHLMDRIPPPAAALIAREGRMPITIKQIALRANLSVQRATWISSQESWVDVPVGDACAFMAGCGIYPSTMADSIRYIRRAVKGKAPFSRRLGKPGALRLLAALTKE